ncbi:exonuclease domain-containing protein [Paenibacillus koleovorans]|uniref:exonuclease domain-containing protein n=1 Tax=Paenibacillus koleovorans TaxID=121608 RepID=UPI000FDA2D51|nr:exonuclease domain-containing protein [Paenibacillus koleovorans]
MKDMSTVGRMWHLYKKGGITPAVASMFDPQNAQHMAFIRSFMKEQRKNSLYEVRLENMEAVVFDLETTGFSPYNGDEIISIGAISISGGFIKQEETFYSLTQPKGKIPEQVERLTGITTEEAAKAPELITVLREFLEFVQHRVLIVHGSGHDKHFLNSALWKTSKVNLSHRLLDCLILAKRMHPKLGNYSLDALLDMYEIESDSRHHALYDSVMTARLWGKLLHEVMEREVLTLGDLYEYLSH